MDNSLEQSKGALIGVNSVSDLRLMVTARG